MQSPCLYFDPWIFSSYFLSSVLLRRRSERCAWWAPGSQPRSIYHTSFLHRLQALITLLDPQISCKGCEFLCVWRDGPTGTVTVKTIWNLVLVVKVQRQSFDCTDTAAWSHLVWKTWKNELEAFSHIFYKNKKFTGLLWQVTFETMWLFLISLLSAVSICHWLISFFTVRATPWMRLAAADTISCIWLLSHSVFTIP